MKRNQSFLHFSIFFLVILVGESALAQITNGGFESGTVTPTPGWTWTTANSVNPVSSYASFARSGSYYLWLGDDNGNDAAYQSVAIPSNATAATLSFYYNINTSQTATSQVDTFSASIVNSTGSTVLAVVGSWSNLNGTTAGSYSNKTFNLMPYAGQTVRIYFISSCTLVGSKTTNFRVDDVSVAITTAALSITTTALNPPTATVGTGYSALQAVTATGGQTPYTWTASGLPSGMAINSSTGALYGTPSVANSFNVTVTAKDSSSLQQTASKALPLTVNNTAGLSVTPLNPSVSATASSISISVSNTGGGAMSYSTGTPSASWFRVQSGGTGGNSGTITIAYDANTGTQRSGTIPVTASGASGSPATVTIIQTSGSTGIILYGVDVSQYTTVTSWAAVYGAGKVFAFIKASSGVNGNYGSLIQGHVQSIKSTAPNLLVSAYHFAYPNYRVANTGTGEAQNFLNNAGNYVGPGYLPPVLDIEDGAIGSTTWVISQHLTANELVAWVKAWIAEVQRQKGTSIKPIIYTTGGYAKYIGQATNGAELAAYPLWIATYPAYANSNPATGLSTGIGPWSSASPPWTFQQYRSDPATQKTDPSTTIEPYVAGSCPGISGYADLDSFNGDSAALNALANGGNPPPSDIVKPTISTFTVGPSAIPLGQAVSIGYTVSDSGGSHLKQVELWRADIDGTVNDSSWAQIGSNVILSGDGPVSNSFPVDVPTAVGNYWYGIHVTDNALPNNYVDERLAGLGPKQVTVGANVSVTVQSSPAGTSFTVDGTTYTSAQTFSWTSGASHVIATTSPQSGGTGTQYAFGSWSDGGGMSHAVSPTSNTTYTANFTTQYYLTMNAGTGGTVSPSSGWKDSGTSTSISASAGGGYTFNSWAGSGSGSYSGGSSSTSVTMNGPITETASFTIPNISVTVQSNPSGRSFTVDGTTYTSAQTFSWISGAGHTIATTSPQSGGTGAQYVFGNWSDGGGMSHTVSPTSNTTYTANFTTQYFLTMTAGTGGMVSPGSGWKDSGTSASISASANTNYTFSSWAGSGAGSYSGSNSSTSVTMNGPIAEIASFAPITNVSVTVQSSPAGRSFTVDGTTYTSAQTFSWTSGASHTIATISPQSGGTGTQYVWSNWSDGGGMSHTVSPTSGTTYTANFTTQFYLTMTAGAGGTVSPSSNGWYNSGTSVPISATASGGYTFSSWAGSGSGSYSGSSSPTSVTMNGPVSETASFVIGHVPGSATRTLPAGYVPTVALTVTVSANPLSSASSYAVEDVPPSGWTVTTISSGGTLDTVSGKVKWGLFFDNIARTLTYQVTTPLGESGVKTFAGSASFDGQSASTLGDSLIDKISILYHPGDTNGDLRIVINELTAYGSAWKTGASWGNPPTPIDVNYVTRAGYLWKNAEVYHYDSSQAAPLSWQTGAAAAALALQAKVALAPTGTGQAIRGLPTAYTAGSPVNVAIISTPAAGTSAYALEDAPPAGWTVGNVDNGGVWDSVNGKVKWGPFFDNTARTLNYQATPPAGTTGSQSFNGAASFDGVGASVGGAGSINDAQPVRYTLILNPTAGGSIGASPQPGIDGKYADEAVVTLTAIPSGSGFQFASWSGDVSGAVNPRTVTMNSNKSVTAAFAQTFTVTPNPGPNGSMTPSTVQAISPGGSIVFSATPARGYAVDRWLVNGSAVQFGGTAHTLAAVSADATVQATFAPSLAAGFARLKGGYSGLIEPSVRTHAHSGRVSLNLGGTGAFTATVVLGGKTYALHGAFGPGGSYSALIPRTEFAVNLLFDLNDPDGKLTGTIAETGVLVANLTTNRTPIGFTARNPVPRAGRYTILLPADAAHPEATYPQGSGYAKLVVLANGAVTLSGVLGDLTPVSQGGWLSKNGEFPLYVPLYGGKGAVTGWLSLRDATAANHVEGTLNWFKPATNTTLYPAEFSGQIAVAGSLYIAPPVRPQILDSPTGHANFTITGGNVTTTPATKDLTIDTKNKNKIVGTEKFTLTLTPGTGLFSGAFYDSDRKARTFRGAVLQKQNSGTGLFKGNGETGRVEIDPTP